MAVDINLLPDEEREKTAKKVLKKKVNLVSGAILGLILIILVGIFSYWGLLKRREANLTNKIKDQESQIQSLSQVESLVRILKAKSQAISQVFNKQKNYGEILANFAQFVPTGVYLTEFAIGEDGKIRTLGVAANSQEFANFVLGLTSKEGGKFYSQVAVDALSGAPEGGLRFGLSLNFK